MVEVNFKLTLPLKCGKLNQLAQLLRDKIIQFILKTVGNTTQSRLEVCHPTTTHNSAILTAYPLQISGFD